MEVFVFVLVLTTKSYLHSCKKPNALDTILLWQS